MMTEEVIMKKHGIIFTFNTNQGLVESIPIFKYNDLTEAKQKAKEDVMKRGFIIK